MIHIEDNKLTITVERSFVEEFYVDMVVEMIDIMYCKDDDFTQNHKNLLLLLEAMMPDYKQIKAMRGVEADTNN